MGTSNSEVYKDVGWRGERSDIRRFQVARMKLSEFRRTSVHRIASPASSSSSSSGVGIGSSMSRRFETYRSAVSRHSTSSLQNSPSVALSMSSTQRTATLHTLKQTTAAPSVNPQVRQLRRGSESFPTLSAIIVANCLTR